MGNTRNTGYLQNAIKVSDTGAITFVSGSTTLATLNTTGQLSGSAPVVFASTASFVANAQSASNAVSAQTSSFANTLTVASTLTAQTLVVQTITSSIDYVTGSTRFGSLSSNTMQVTGSVLVTGSIQSTNYYSQPSATISGLGTLDFGYIGRGTVNGSALLINDIPGANYAIATGGYNLTFYKHISGSNTFANVMSINGGNATNATPSITFANNVGIGTTSLSYPLTRNGMTLKASGTDGAEFVMLSSADTGFTGGAVVRSGADFGFINRTNGMLIFATNAVERMYVTSGGNVGIGTSSPRSTSGYTFLAINNATNGGYVDLYNAGTLTTSLGAENGWAVLNAQNGYLAFYTVSTERMRMTSGGNFGIGASTLNDRLAVQGGNIAKYTTSGIDGATDNLIKYGYFADLNTSSANNARWVGADATVTAGSGNANRFIIRAYGGGTGNAAPTTVAIFCGDGAVYNYSNSTQWSTTSDIRIKENISTINNALDIISQLRPVTFDYKQEYATNKKWDNTRKNNNIGFIAQEFKEIFPKYTHLSEEIVDGVKVEDLNNIDTGHLTPLLVAAIKELKAENDTLKEILQRNNIQ